MRSGKRLTREAEREAEEVERIIATLVGRCSSVDAQSGAHCQRAKDHDGDHKGWVHITLNTFGLYVWSKKRQKLKALKSQS